MHATKMWTLGIVLLLLSGCLQKPDDGISQLSSSSEKSVAGFSLEDVLASRPHATHTLRWVAPSILTNINPTEVTLTFRYGGAPIFQRVFTQAPRHDPSSDILPTAQITTDVEFTLSTSDGSFSEESMVGHLSATAANEMIVDGRLDPLTLSGTFVAARLDHAGLSSIWVEQHSFPNGIGGSIDLEASTNDPVGPGGMKSGSGQVVQIALWP